MAFPTTIDAALALSPEDAERFLEQLGYILEDKIGDYEGPANVSLACLIYTLDQFSNIPNNPFGPEGWRSLVQDD